MAGFSGVVNPFAAELLAGPWEPRALLRRAEETAGGQAGWISTVVDGVMASFPGPQPPARRALRRMLIASAPLRLAWQKGLLKKLRRSLKPPPMAPSPWPVAKFESDGELCRWLEIQPEQLDWLADVHGRERTRFRGPLRHYVYRWVKKRSGGVRLLETPKSKLKSIQRKLLRKVLDVIPAHPAAHGFVRGRSIKGFVAAHAGRGVVLRVDLQDFFLSINASRIHALYGAIGYPESIARLLTGLCTNSTPPSVLRMPDIEERFSGFRQMQFRTPHLPQGAPTSPALANLCARRLDARLTALASKYGWIYTRYADDLLFSAQCANTRFLKSFLAWIGAIAADEKFSVNYRKTRIMRRSVRQHAAGLTLNEKPNLRRTDFDQLKAILHNCAKLGPETQNREKHAQFRAHLQGRVAYSVQINPARGAKLKALFERIRWPS